MALRKITYTKPIPEGADLFTRKGKRFARFKDNRGRTVEAPLNDEGTRLCFQSKKWYGEYKDADGTEHRIPLSTDHTAAERMLSDLKKQVERVRAGIAERGEEENATRPLADHLTAFEHYIRTRVRRGKRRQSSPQDPAHPHCAGRLRLRPARSGEPGRGAGLPSGHGCR